MELAKTDDRKLEIQVVTKAICDDFLFSQGTKLNEQQKTLFYNLAVQFNLNPFKHEIHAIPFGSGWNYVTGYQVYVARAEATGLLNGWHVESMGNEKGDLVGAKITIHRKDWGNPFIWEVSFAECNKNQGLWKTMPEFMIKKIAIGQGFRLAFPNELGGMPYLKEELEDITPSKLPITPPQAKKDIKAEQTAEGNLIVRTTIEKTSSKEGNKGGKKWTLYGVLASGIWYNTFDIKIFDIAVAKAGQEVEIEYTEGEKGKNLIAIKFKGCSGNPTTCDLSLWENEKPVCEGGIACIYEIKKCLK